MRTPITCKEILQELNKKENKEMKEYGFLSLNDLVEETVIVLENIFHDYALSGKGYTMRIVNSALDLFHYVDEKSKVLVDYKPELLKYINKFLMESLYYCHNVKPNSSEFINNLIQSLRNHGYKAKLSDNQLIIALM